MESESKKKVKSGKDRQQKGFGGLNHLKNGNYEGTLYVYKENGDSVFKSFTRPTIKEVNHIKYQLKALEPLDNDVIKIKIDKHSNEITLIKDADLKENKSKLNGNMTVDDYVEYWLWNHRRKGQKRKRIKATAFQDYVQKSEFIKKKLGTKTIDGKEYKVKVESLTFDFVERKLLELYEEVSENTAIQVRNHVFNMMKWAKKDGVIKENPLQDETINFPESTNKFKRKIIEETDVEEVIKHCLELWYIDVLTQLLTGARLSEIRGLRWCNIDEVKCEIHIEENYTTSQQYELNEKGHIEAQGTKSDYTTVKSKSSDRIIKIEEEFMDILKKHKEVEQEKAYRQGVPFKETDPVFTGRESGKQLGKNTTNERVKKVVADLKIKDWEEITSHCLRKSFCCAGILNGVPLEYMSKILGHSSTKVTEAYYLEYKQEKINDYAEQTNMNRLAALHNITKSYSIAVPQM